MKTTIRENKTAPATSSFGSDESNAYKSEYFISTSKRDRINPPPTCCNKTSNAKTGNKIWIHSLPVILKDFFVNIE